MTKRNNRQEKRHQQRSAVLAHTGRPDYFAFNQADEAEAELRQANETLQALVQASPVAVLALDLLGNVLFWNPAAEQLFGWKQAEVLGQPAPMVPEPAQEEHFALLQCVLGGESLEKRELRRRRRDDSLVDVSMSAAPLRAAGGQITGSLILFTDTSEQKRLEAQLRQLQKMEAVSRLAGQIAHDFNNLLTVVLCHSEALLRNPAINDTMSGSLEQIKQAGERATTLTRQLLAFSRKQVLQPRVLDLNTVVGGLEKMLVRLIGEDITLRTCLAPQLGPAKADPCQIEQILLNLVVNARDAMTSGGQLAIETANVNLDETYARTQPGLVPGSYVMLAVSDTGCGMSDEVKAHLFEPFFTTKEPARGTGLGLATVYGIIKQSEGHITVYSEPGIGTTVKVYFPQIEGKSSATAAAGVPDPLQSGSETILVVEDYEAVRELIVSVLRRQGYTVLEASKSQEAAELGVRHEGPLDLLLTDVVLPELNGPDLAERLTTIHPEIKVLYVSGYTDNILHQQTRMKADSPFLCKPFTPAELVSKVREVLQAKTTGSHGAD